MSVTMFIILVTVVMFFMPYVIGVVVSFVAWHNVIEKRDLPVLLRMGIVSALIGLATALLQIYSR